MKMNKIKRITPWLLTAFFALSLTKMPAWAGDNLLQVTSQASQNANDSVSWSQPREVTLKELVFVSTVPSPPRAG
jgi:hypothetical protein